MREHVSQERIDADLPAPDVLPEPIQPQDEWERRLLGLAKDCGVSLSNADLSREEMYD